MVDFDALVIGPAMAVFGTACTYTPVIPTLDAGGRPVLDANGNPVVTIGTPYSITGVFMAQYQEVPPVGRGPFASTEAMEYGAIGGITEARPMLGVQLSAMATAPQQGDQVLINGTSYLVREVQPDGVGAAKLLLNLGTA